MSDKDFELAKDLHRIQTHNLEEMTMIKAVMRSIYNNTKNYEEMPLEQARYKLSIINTLSKPYD